MKLRHKALLAGLALVVLAAGGAYAAIPDESAVFHACMKKTFGDDGTPRGKGELRLIDHAAGEDCNANSETHVHFNERGQKGDTGEKGEQGDPGPQGPPGTDGVSITSAPEPAGANCANGGSAFTSASGVTYACNGADGPPGTGATTFEAILSRSNTDGELLLGTLPNGVEIFGHCNSNTVGVRLSPGSHFRVSGFGVGSAFEENVARPIHSDPLEPQFAPFNVLLAIAPGRTVLSAVVAPADPVDDGDETTSDAIAAGPFVRIDIVGRESHLQPGETDPGEGGGICRFSGLITPLTQQGSVRGVD